MTAYYVLQPKNINSHHYGFNFFSIKVLGKVSRYCISVCNKTKQVFQDISCRCRNYMHLSESAKMWNLHKAKR